MRRMFLAAAGCVLAIAPSGCSDEQFVSNDEAPGQFGSDPWSAGPVFAGDDGEGNACLAAGVATELPASALVGDWSYVNSTMNWNGDQIEIASAGALVMTADGRWDGSRMMGGQHTGVATGPGTWTFDGRNLTLTYDDGSSPEFYDAVLVSEQVHDTGVPFVALTLENNYDDGSGCIVHVLAKVPTP